jgi:hypothetical protein
MTYLSEKGTKKRGQRLMAKSPHKNIALRKSQEHPERKKILGRNRSVPLQPSNS